MNGPETSRRVQGTVRDVRQTLADLDHPGVLVSVPVGWFAFVGTRFTLPALFPRIKSAFGLTNATVGLAMSVIWITFALTQFPAGVLSDRIELRHVLVVGALLGGGSTLLLGGAIPFVLFLVGCALFGPGMGLYATTRGLVLTESFPENAGVAIGVTMAAGNVGAALTPLLAVRLANHVGWRPTLLALAAPFLVAAVALQGSVPSLGRPIGATPTLRELRSSVGDAVSRRSIRVAVVAVGFTIFVFQGLTAFLPILLVEAKGLDQTTGAGIYALLFVGCAVFQPLAGRLADDRGARPVLLAVTALSLVPLAGVLFATEPIVLAATVFLLGVQRGVVPVTNAYIVDALPGAARGGNWGMVRSLFLTIGAIGSVSVGIVIDAAGFAAAIGGLVVVMVLALSVFAVLPTSESQQ